MTPKINVATIDFLSQTSVEEAERRIKSCNGKQSGVFCICNMLQQRVFEDAVTFSYMQKLFRCVSACKEATGGK